MTTPFEKVKELAKQKGILLCEGREWISSYTLKVVNHPPEIEFSSVDAIIALHEIAHVMIYQNMDQVELTCLIYHRKKAFGPKAQQENLMETYKDEEKAWKLAEELAKEIDLHNYEFITVRDWGLSTYKKE